MNFAGYQSRIVHQVYAKNAAVNIQSLEAFKESKNEVELLRTKTTEYEAGKAKLAALEQQQQLKEAV